MKGRIFIVGLFFSFVSVVAARGESPSVGGGSHTFLSRDGVDLGTILDIAKENPETTIAQGSVPTVRPGNQMAWNFNRPFDEISVTFASPRGNVNIVVKTAGLINKYCIIDNLDTDNFLSTIVSTSQLTPGDYIVDFITKDALGNIITYEGTFKKR